MNKCSLDCSKNDSSLDFMAPLLGFVFLFLILTFMWSISFFNMQFLDASLPKEKISYRFERVEFTVASATYDQKRDTYDIVMRTGPYLAEFSCHTKPPEGFSLTANADLYTYKAVSGAISHVAQPFGPFCLLMIGQMMKDAEAEKESPPPVRKVKPKGQSMIAVR